MQQPYIWAIWDPWLDITAAGHWESHFTSLLDTIWGLTSILPFREIIFHFHLGRHLPKCLPFREIPHPESTSTGNVIQSHGNINGSISFPWPKRLRVGSMIQSRQFMINSVISSIGLWGRGLFRARCLAGRVEACCCWRSFGKRDYAQESPTTSHRYLASPAFSHT